MQSNKGSSRVTLVVAGLALLVAAIGWLFLKPTPAPAPEPSAAAAPEQTAAATPAAQAAATDDNELRPQSPAERAHMAPPPVVIQPVSRPAPSATSVAPAPAPAPALPPASAYTRQLVSGLTNLDFSRGPLTKEQADQWRASFQTLTNQGAAAIPAIREFLGQNQEMNFAAVPGGNQLGETSLRSAMINALAQIGGPEANGVLLQTLQSTTLPSEIAQLAQIFEQQAPGQYRQETLGAINDVLGMASKGQLVPGTDVGPLFKALQNYGDSGAATALEQLQNDWKYYSTMSLADLQNGAGVPSLIREVQDPSGGRKDFAYQMLAQVAGQYTDAASALMDAARAGQIPDSAWSKIATGLAGDQYQIGSPPPGSLSGLKTYHIQSGNQNFYSLPLGPGDQATQNLQLINQLLGVTSSPVGRQALQNAQATLTGQTAAR